MSKKCVKCGAELADDAIFCTECGTKAEVVTDITKEFGQAPAAPGAATYTTNAAPQPTSSTQYNYNAAPAAPVAGAAPAVSGTQFAPVMKTAAFFWLDVLYAIPFAGLIACIIICAASKNPNMRHHAAAKLIEILVATVISILVTVICMVAVRQAGLNLNDLMNSNGLSSFY